MEPNKVEGDRDPQTTASRTLDRVSHLFLSQADWANRERYRGGSDVTAETAQGNPAHPVVLLGSRPLAREQLLSCLREQPAAMEEGMRVLDANLPCETPGGIELIAVDSTKQLAVIDVDDKPDDGLLLRGLAHLDWVVRNIPLVRRMYQGQPINFTLYPRLVLVAPGFSPLFHCAVPRIQPLRIDCLRYYTVGLPGGGIGLFCEHLLGTPENRNGR